MVMRLPSGNGPWYSEEDQNIAHPTSHALRNTALLGAAGYGVFQYGHTLDEAGAPLWNKWAGYLRTAEELSPGRLLRTLQLSTIASSFGTGIQEGGTFRPNTVFHTPTFLKQNRVYANYLSSLLNDPKKSQHMYQKGIRLADGKAYFGDTAEVALEHARGLVGSSAEGSLNRYAEAWFLGMGNDPGQMQIGSHTPSRLASLRNTIKESPVFITGANSELEYLQRSANAVFTEAMARPNRLAATAADIEPLKSIFGFVDRKWGDVTESLLEQRYPLRLGVAYGTGAEMAGRFAAKYGVYVPLAIGAYKTLDWLGRETIGAGPTDVGAYAWTRSQVLISQAAEVTGLHNLRERQEEAAPGSTRLSKLAAIPLIGGLVGGASIYLSRMHRTLDNMKAGMTATEAKDAAIKYYDEFVGEGVLSEAGRYLRETKGAYQREDFLGKAIRKIASPTEGGEELYFKGFGKLTANKAIIGLGAAIGIALISPYLPGALVPSHRPAELEAIYSGEQEVPIRKGRWWEFGRTPFEGSRVEYYRPHWYARMRQRGTETQVWGDGDIPSPLGQFLRREFTYDLERKHYEDRPYPVTALPFEDVPVLGPLLSRTLGRIIKPPQLMHTEEWMTGEGETLDLGPGFGGTVATGLGEAPMGSPITPFGLKGGFGEQFYRLSEMSGLPGFFFQSMKQKVTGTGSFFEEERQLESARRINGLERRYWDMNLGGGLGTTEFIRRLIPHKRNEIELYNPISNTMPSWIPGMEDRSKDFTHGDPYSKIQEGEIRLPGEGYATRYPEDYPLVHRLKILADVAPYSDKYKQTLAAARGARNAGILSSDEQEILSQTLDQIAEKRKGKDFREYKHLSPMGRPFGNRTYYADHSSSVLATLNKMKAQESGSGPIGSMYGGYWELLSHAAETSLDQLTPFSPGAKFMNERSALEDYQQYQVYGTENAFWDKPWSNFLRPTAYLTAHSLGYEGIPKHVEQVRNLEQYFDILKYVKYTRLSKQAAGMGDTKSAAEFRKQKESTLFGINPYTYDFSKLMSAIPRRERDYFNAFSGAQTEEERAKILQLVPDNMKGLYMARWRLQLANDVRRAEKQGQLSVFQQKEASEIMAKVYDEARTEGMPKNEELWAEYLATRQDGETYPDWYRRTKLLAQVPGLPGPDWVGWHPQVDLEDIKLLLVKSQGEDMHDYNLWPSRERRLPNKPYLASAIEPLQNLSAGDMRQRIDELLKDNNIKRFNTFMRSGYSQNDNPSVTLNYEQERSLGLNILNKAFE
jgi:hypothetical protein